MKYIKTLEAFLVTEKPYSKEKIVVFDLDDTLVITDAKIKVCNRVNGECFSLTPEEFNEYEASVEIKNKNNIRSLTSNKETVPAAIGRYFFVGWNMSMFLSDKSLKIYVTVVIK